MGLILSIETSTNVCSVALHNDGKLLGLQNIIGDKSHSKVILSQIEALFLQTSYVKEQLNAIAVSKGPGSYTGLRIGISTAKGLSYALDKPLIGINTLEAMSFGMNRFNLGEYLLCPMIDARRMEVYCCISDSNNKILLPTHAHILKSESFSEILDTHKLIFFGNGSDKCKILFRNRSNALFVDDITPSAENIGFLAEALFNKGIFENTAYFEPFYLKDFILTSIKS